MISLIVCLLVVTMISSIDPHIYRKETLSHPLLKKHGIKEIEKFRNEYHLDNVKEFKLSDTDILLITVGRNVYNLGYPCSLVGPHDEYVTGDIRVYHENTNLNMTKLVFLGGLGEVNGIEIEKIEDVEKTYVSLNRGKCVKGIRDFLSVTLYYGFSLPSHTIKFRYWYGPGMHLELVNEDEYKICDDKVKHNCYIEPK